MLVANVVERFVCTLVAVTLALSGCLASPKDAERIGPADPEFGRQEAWAWHVADLEGPAALSIEMRGSTETECHGTVKFWTIGTAVILFERGDGARGSTFAEVGPLAGIHVEGVFDSRDDYSGTASMSVNRTFSPWRFAGTEHRLHLRGRLVVPGGPRGGFPA
jgi:hypothetical protein